jgi:hypothetical protein
MNIIFGRDQAEQMQSRYTVLELDSFSYQGQLVNAFCIVEQIPILDMSRVESMKNLHTNLLENYRKGDWNFCEQALEHLVGFWGQDMDTFYSTLQQRIVENKNKTLNENWWIIDKNFN